MHFVEGNRKPQYVLNNRSLFQLKCAVSGEVKKNHFQHAFVILFVFLLLLLVLSIHLFFSLYVLKKSTPFLCGQAETRVDMLHWEMW